MTARCEEIICAESGFANLSCWIGGVKPRSPYTYYSEDETLRLLESAATSSDIDDPRISNLQRSFAIWATFTIRGFSIADSSTDRELLDKAIHLDPENDFFLIVKASSLINAGRFVEADELLNNSVKSDTVMLQSMLKTIKGIHPDGRPVIGMQIPYLIEAATDGYPMAALYVALCKQALGNLDEAAHYAKLYRANKGDLDTPLEAHLRV